jgi:hypothetical protein
MSKPQSSGFELGPGSFHERIYSCRIPIGEIRESGLPLEDREHLDGVFLPIRRAMNIAIGSEMINDTSDKRRLDQAPFVVTRLVPGIGEEDVYTR